MSRMFGYSLIRRGRPKEADQRAALIGAGVPEARICRDEVASSRPKPEHFQSRACLIEELRAGDRVLIATAACGAVTSEELTRFAEAVLARGAVLVDLRSGLALEPPPSPEALKVLARKHTSALAGPYRSARLGAPRQISEAELAEARKFWDDPSLSQREAAAKAGLSVSTLRRNLGPRL